MSEEACLLSKGTNLQWFYNFNDIKRPSPPELNNLTIELCFLIVAKALLASSIRFLYLKL